jgi:ubiquinone/menaquinone biosynthesis C-methylase UbiE
MGGLLYDFALETFLRGIKRRVTEYFAKYDLFPAVDICCGTGVQCHRIKSINPEIYGLDWDFKMITYAASKYPGLCFMCADAVQMPLKSSCFKGAVLSYSLHDKSPEIRIKILEDVERILKPDGKIVFVDFERPRSRKSRLGWLFTSGIERSAGEEHFSNGRHFLNRGGLKAFLKQNGLVEIERTDVELAHTGIVVARFS